MTLASTSYCTPVAVLLIPLVWYSTSSAPGRESRSNVPPRWSISTFAGALPVFLMVTFAVRVLPYGWCVSTLVVFTVSRPAFRAKSARRVLLAATVTVLCSTGYGVLLAVNGWSPVRLEKSQ